MESASFDTPFKWGDSFPLYALHGTVMPHGMPRAWVWSKLDLHCQIAAIGFEQLRDVFAARNIQPHDLLMLHTWYDHQRKEFMLGLSIFKPLEQCLMTYTDIFTLNAFDARYSGLRGEEWRFDVLGSVEAKFTLLYLQQVQVKTNKWSY